jgi:hypothetical protein
MSTKTRQSKSRGAVSPHSSVFIGAWIPTEWLEQIDELVRAQDLDRSKFVRRALARHAEIPGHTHEASV